MRTARPRQTPLGSRLKPPYSSSPHCLWCGKNSTVPDPGGEQVDRMGSHTKKEACCSCPRRDGALPGYRTSSRQPQQQQPRAFSQILSIWSIKAAQTGNDEDFTESFRLEKILKVIRSSHQPNTAKSTLSEAMP